MNILKKIKQLLFGKNEIKALPEQIRSNVKDYRNEVVLIRNDGTTVTITPQLDRVGNQLYEQVWSGYEKQIKCIPKFLVYSEELKEISINKNVYAGTDMLIDIEPSDLQNPKFAEYVANNVLNKERMIKIVDEYCNYAGRVRKTEKGFIKERDMSVIKNLKLEEEKRFRMIDEELDRKNRETRANIIKDDREVNYKTSHAEDLSKYER